MTLSHNLTVRDYGKRDKNIPQKCLVNGRETAIFTIRYVYGGASGF
jgi:hypothetical protein